MGEEWASSVWLQLTELEPRNEGERSQISTFKLSKVELRGSGNNEFLAPGDVQRLETFLLEKGCDHPREAESNDSTEVKA